MAKKLAKKPAKKATRKPPQIKASASVTAKASAKKKPAKRKKKAPKPNPFDGSATLQLIKQPPAPVIKVDQNNGVVSRLVVDKSGLTSYFEEIGEEGPIGSLPPEIGSISDELADLIRSGSPMDGDGLLARSAASFVSDSARYNANLYARAVTAYNDWRRTGKRKEPTMPAAATFDRASFQKGVNHYRPANFEEVLGWMRAHNSGGDSNSAIAAIPIPPEYDY